MKDRVNITNNGTKISFRVSEETAQLLKEIAYNNYMSVSAYIRKSIDEKITQEYKNMNVEE